MDTEEESISNILNTAEMDDLRYFQKKRDRLLHKLSIVNKQLDTLSEAVIVYRLTKQARGKL